MHFLLFLFLSSGPFLLAETVDPHSPVAARPKEEPVKTTPAEEWLRDIEKIKGHSVEQSTESAAWNYYAPNEHFNYVFEKCLPKEGGAYLSVGTFRGLNVASSGKVSHLVLMDIDPGIVVFNKMNLQLIAKAKDRFEYLSLLMSGKSGSNTEKLAREGKISENDFLNSFSYNSILSFDEWNKDLNIILNERDKEFLKRKFFSDTLSMIQIEFNVYQKITKNWDKTFMGNDERFKKMQDLISGKKVTVIASNITNEKTFDSLVSALKAAELKVSAADFSNAFWPVYVGVNQPKLFTNLRKLPFREKGRYLFTDGGAGSSDKNGESWNYYALPKEHLEGMKELKRGEGYGLKTFSTGEKELILVRDPSNHPDRNILYTPEGAPCEE